MPLFRAVCLVRGRTSGTSSIFLWFSPAVSPLLTDSPRSSLVPGSAVHFTIHHCRPRSCLHITARAGPRTAGPCSILTCLARASFEARRMAPSDGGLAVTFLTGTAVDAPPLRAATVASCVRIRPRPLAGIVPGEFREADRWTAADCASHLKR